MEDNIGRDKRYDQRRVFSEAGSYGGRQGGAIDYDGAYEAGMNSDRELFFFKDGSPKKKWAVRVAQLLSFVLNPLFVPVYAVVIYLFTNPIMAIAPSRLRLYYAAVTVLGAVVIPAFSVGLLRALGIISNVALRHRQDRTIPLAVTALSYGICVFMISKTDPLWSFMIRKFFIAAFCSSAAAALITAFWKVSIHMMSIGGATALLVIMLIATADNAGLVLPVCLAFLLCGLLASSRLYLEKHTPAQVGAGFLTGFLITAAAMLLIG